MRRFIQATIAASLLALALPAVAPAHGSARHFEARHHHRHHRRAHTVVFTHGTARTIPGVAPVTPAPATPEGEPAGTIASFEGGVLKITLADGSTVAGKVTERTEISCGQEGREDFGDDNGHDGEGGDDSSGSGGDHGGLAGSHGDDEHGGQAPGEMGEGTCGVAAPTPGAKVAEAELVVSSAGSVWEKIELAQ